MKIDIRARWRQYTAGAALAAGGIAVGAILASGAIANAADPTPTPSSSATDAPATRDESKSQRPDETLLTGDTAAKVTEAALAKYPGATIQRVETDSDGVYEAHLTTADGTRVTVQIDKDFAITGEERAGGAK